MIQKDLSNSIRKYISLQEAAQFCNYSQEYLSLRARQGKMKSVKLGRNWVTTKEWLEEYLQHNGNGNGHPVAQFAKVITPPENLPVEQKYFQPEKTFRRKIQEFFGGISLKPLVPRDSFIFALAFILIMAGGVAGKESLKIAGDGISKSISFAAEKIGHKEIAVEGSMVSVGDIFQNSFAVFQNYSAWAGKRVQLFAEKIEKSGTSRIIKTDSEVFGDFSFWAGQKIKRGAAYGAKPILAIGETVSGFFSDLMDGVDEFASNAWRKIAPGKGFFVSKEDFESLKLALENLKNEPFIVKRVEVSKVVEPIKEITREIEHVQKISQIDESSLKQIRDEIAFLQKDVQNRLYAPGGVISQTIYVKEPIQSPKIYQENGEIVLQTLGQGNVILSAATGLQLYGRQVVIESTSVLNPLVYIDSPLRVKGDFLATGAANIGSGISAQTITLTAPSTYSGNLVNVTHGDTQRFTMTDSGATTLVGNFTITGDFVVTGDQTFNGAVSIATSSASAALTVAQSGTGKIFDFSSTGSGVTVDLGTITGTTQGVVLAIAQYGTGLVLDASGTVRLSEAALSVASKVMDDLLFATNFNKKSLIGTRGQLPTYADSDNTPTFETIDDAAQTAPAGNAVKFTYSGETLNYPASGSLGAATSTISFWYSPDYGYSTTADKYLFEAQNFLRLFYDGSAEKFVVQAYDGADWTTSTATSSAQTFSANDWIHIVVTYAASSSTAPLTLYVNNSRATSTNTWTAQSLPANFYIGSDSSGANQAHGLIADFNIFDRVLFQPEVQQIYYLKRNLQDYAQYVLGKSIIYEKTPETALAVYQYGTGSIITATSSVDTTSAAVKFTNLGSGNTLLIEDSDADSSPFVITASGDVAVSTTTARYKFDVWGDLAIGTTTDYSTPLLTIDSGGYSTGTDNLAYASLIGPLYQQTYGSDDGLVLYLPFSEGSVSTTASIAYDRSPFGNNGTLTGFPMPSANATSGSGWSTTTCKAGSCLIFDGADDYIDVGSSDILNLRKTVTIEAWIKTDSFSGPASGAQRVIRKATATGGASYFLYIDNFYGDAKGRLIGGVVIGSTEYSIGDAGARNQIKVNQWYHTVLTYDGSYVKGWVNGNLVESIIASGDMDSAAANFYVGSREGSTQIFNGAIDEVRVYNRALSADEIRTHYLRGSNANGTILANNFRIVNTTNTVTFQIDGAGNATFAKAGATTTFSGNIKVSDDKWLGLGENEGRLVFDNQSTDYLNILNASVGISTTSPRYTLDVWGDMAIGTSTQSGGVNVPALYVDSGDGGRIGIGTTTLAGLLTVGTSTPIFVIAPNGYIGIGTTTPEEALSVVGNARVTGDILTVSGNILPATPQAQDIGSAAVDWANIYANNIYANNINAGSSTVSGTSAGTFTINSDTAGDATSTLRFYRGVDTPHALLNWDADYDRFNLNFPLYLSGTGSLTAATSLTISSGGSGDIALSPANNVGIATTSPRYKLDVWGDMAIGTSTGTNVPALYVDSGDGGRVGIGTTTLSGLFAIGTSTLSFIVDPAGKTGIGATTTPNEQLSVAGNIMGSGNIVIYGSATSTYAGGLQAPAIKLTNGATANYVLVSDANGYATWQNPDAINPENWQFIGANALRPTSTIGIIVSASSTFAADLTIIGNSTTTGNLAAGNILFVDQTTGRIGIATTTPRTKFDIWGDMAIGTSTMNWPTISSSTPTFYIDSNYSGADWGRVGIGTTTLSGLLTVGTSTPLFVVAPDGNVGIGTTTPSQKLHVITGGDGSVIFEDTVTASVLLKSTYATGRNWYLQAQGSAGGAFRIYDEGIGGAGGVGEVLTITGSGNVGIATTSPRYKLDVQGDFAVGTTTNNSIFYTNTGTSWGVGVGTTTLANKIFSIGTTTDYLVVDRQGRMGIASSTPSEQLAVQGNIIGSGNIVIYGSATSTYAGGLQASAIKLTDSPGVNYVLTSDANGYATWQNPDAINPENWQFIGANALRPTSTIGIIVSASSTFAADLTIIGNSTTTGNLAAGNILFVDQTTGRIGIATTTPRTKFDIWGDMAIGTSTMNWPTISSSTPTFYIDSNYSGADWGRVGIGTTTLSGLFTIGTSTTALVISPNTYTGIATTTPSEQLAVQGNIIGSGNLVIYGSATSTYAGGLQAPAIKLTDSPGVNYVLTSDANGYAAWQNPDAINPENWQFIGANAIRPTSTVGIIVNASSTFAHNVSMGTSSQPTMFVDSGNGRVGIGTTNPGYSLQVAGNSYISGKLGIGTYQSDYGLAVGISNTRNQLYLYNSGAVTRGAGIYFTAFDAGTTIRDESMFYNPDDDYIGIGGSYGAEKFIVKDSGNVGIGTTAPSEILTVFSTTDPTLQIGSGTATTTIIGNGTSTFPGGFIVDTSTLYLMSDLNRIGIGTTTPRYTLDVWGDFAVGTSTATSSTAIVPAFFVDSGDRPQIGIGTTTLNNNLLTVGTTTPALAVGPTGNVGIGTASPAAKLDISMGASLPLVSATTSAGSSFYGVYVSGKYAYAADYGLNLLSIFDISNPHNLLIATTTTNLDGPLAVSVSGKYAYVVNSNTDTLAIFDVSDPKNIAAKATTSDNLDYPESVYVSGKYAYVANLTNNKLSIFDISNPDKIVAKDSDSTNLVGARHVYVSGKYAYVLSYSTPRLVIFDVSDPNNIVYKGNTSTGFGTSPEEVYVSGKYAYVTSNNTFLIFDVSDPTAIVSRGTISNANISSPSSVYVSGKYAYVANAGGSKCLTVFDVSDPNNIIDKGCTALTTAAQSVFIAGRYAYAAGGNTFSILGISGVDTPALLAGAISGGNLDISDNAIIGNNLYVQQGLNVGAAGIFSQGEMGVYASSSASALTVTQAKTGQIFLATSTSLMTSTAFQITNLGSGNSFLVEDSDTDASPFVIDGSGSVGIASSTPSAQLAVQGNIIGSGSLTVYGTVTSTFGGGLIVDTNSLYVMADTGYVGIGTGVPLNKMSVSVSSANQGIDLQNTTPTTLSRFGIVNTGVDNSGFIGSISNNAFLFYTYGSERIRITSGGNVGIGTSTPRYKLDVWGDMAVGTTTGTGAGTQYPLLFVNSEGGGSSGGVGVGIGTTTLAGLFTIGTSTPRLVVAPDGNVGIASSTPSDILAVQGNIMSSGSLTVYGTATSTFGGGLIVDTSTFYLMSDLNRIGIATTTPRYTLDVWGSLAVGTSTSPIFFVDTGATGNVPGVTFGADVSLGSIQVASSSGAITLVDTVVEVSASAGTEESYSIQIDSNELLRIYAESNGSGGIYNKRVFTPAGVDVAFGTTTPRYDLDVYGTLAVGTSSASYTGASSTPAFYVVSGTGGQVGIGTTTLSTNLFTVGTTTPSLVIANDGNIILAQSSGNVGIGTTTPRYKLDVWGDMAIGTSTGVSVPMNYPLLYVNSGEGGSSNGVGIGTTTVSGTMLTVGTTTPALVVANNGNVGIGTTMPKTQFHIGKSTGAIITLSSNNNQELVGAVDMIEEIDVVGDTSGFGTTNAYGFRSKYDGNTNVFLIQSGNQTTITDRLAIQRDTGNVGIGTTTPRYKLDVWGDMAVGTTTGTGAGTQYPLLFVNSEGGGSSGGIGVGIGTTTLSGLLTVGTTTPLFVVAPDGNVGIGTTGPAAKLEIVGTKTTDSNTNYELNSGGIVFNGNESGVGNWYTQGINFIKDKVGAATTHAYIYGHSSSASTMSLVFGTSEVERMRIQTDGNVGIGTSTPRYKLDVWGDFAVGTSTDTNTPILYVDTGNGGRVGIGTTTPYAALTISESKDFAFGSFNELVIDDMEGSVLNWTNGVDSVTSTESSMVKVGGQSLKFTASTTEDAVVRKTFASAQDWSAYEKLSFWIYADRFATSSATSTQLLTFQVYDANNPSMIQHTVRFQKENRWQYEEVVLNSTGTAAYDGVTYIQFRTDFRDIGDINFYVDQIRAYDDTERSAEMFVGKDGALVITGRAGVELVAPQAGAGALPGVKVDAAVVELGQPLSVNVGGDVGFDYDIQFLNTGLSQITSEGPLRITAGDSNHSENLTLTTGGSGDVIVELSASSSAFMITHAWEASTTIPFIINSESNSTTSPEMDKQGILFQIISDYGSDENTVFSIDASGNYYYDRGAYTPAADVAENYSVEDQSIGAGDVVCLSESNSLTVENCSQTYQTNLIGVVSTKPALVMAADLLSSRPVALAGRVPVKVSLENGPISIGDALTSASSTPGVAMKATRAGKILGYALEPFGFEKSEILNPKSEINSNDQNSNSTNTDSLEFSASDLEFPQQGVILAFIHLDELGGDLSVYQNESGNLVVSAYTANGQTQLFSLDEEGALVVDKIKTQELCVGSVCVTEEDFMRVFGASAGETILGGSTSQISENQEVEPQNISSSTDTEIPNGTSRPCSSEIGACQIGVQIYQDGVWGSCIGAVFPTDEIDDDVDNDCDGQIDEGFIVPIITEPIITSTEPIITTTTESIIDTTTTTEEITTSIATSTTL